MNNITIALVILLPFLIYYTMGLFGSKTHFQTRGSTAIVTGGSQGLGLSVSKLLAARGANVVIVAQDVAKLESAVSQIKLHAPSPSQRFLHLSYDLRSPNSAPDILRNVTEWNNNTPPDILFNVAGHCIPGFFAGCTIDTLREQMDTVYWSCAYLSHAALQLWTQPASKEMSSTPRPARHIIFTSSALAFFPIVGYAPYSPAKAAMRALADILTQEVAMYNGSRSHSSPSAPAADIQIHTLFPCGIVSPGLENENRLKPELTRMLEKDDVPQDPDEVARIAIDRLEKGDAMITTILIGHLMRGMAMASSVRSNFMDYVWQMLGSIVILFVTPDFLSKCRKWGREKGMDGAK